MKTYPSLKQGVSAIEIVVAAGIIIVMAAIFVRPFISFRNEQILIASTESVLTLIREARADTLAAKNDSQYGVHIESYRAVYFAGGAFTEGNPGNREILFPTRVSASASLIGGGSDVAFSRLTGKTEQYGAITLTFAGASSTTRTIMVSEAGAVNIVQ